ncbi:MAG: hypothetical protein LUE93_05755 [Bacteroides sp.]|nr:hypothetical protein [Bacteroides sp.]
MGAGEGQGKFSVKIGNDAVGGAYLQDVRPDNGFLGVCVNNDPTDLALCLQGSEADDQ